MHQPGSWVVCLECDDRHAGIREENHIPPGGVVEFEMDFVPGYVRFSLVYYGEVVTVEMDLG